MRAHDRQAPQSGERRGADPVAAAEAASGTASGPTMADWRREQSEIADLEAAANRERAARREARDRAAIERADLWARLAVECETVVVDLAANPVSSAETRSSTVEHLRSQIPLNIAALNSTSMSAWLAEHHRQPDNEHPTMRDIVIAATLTEAADPLRLPHIAPWQRQILDAHNNGG